MINAVSQVLNIVGVSNGPWSTYLALVPTYYLLYGVTLNLTREEVKIVLLLKNLTRHLDLADKWFFKVWIEKNGTIEVMIRQNSKNEKKYNENSILGSSAKILGFVLWFW